MEYQQLIEKYNVPAPRYTSYPTVPLWDTENFQLNGWLEAVRNTFEATNTSKGLSLYIHLPFCESLCTFCACNKRITKNHNVEDGYIDTVLAEWHMYLDLWQEKPVLRELHLGGGTPTFFSAGKLGKLIRGILKTVKIHPEWEFGFEAHPNNTTREHLQTLFDLGFRRLSLGIQDVDEKVQYAINRMQPVSYIEEITITARSMGYNSINFDIIYGLPFKTQSSIRETMQLVKQLIPERIAFYSYAHVPWKSPGQRRYSDEDIPDNAMKRGLYELGRALFFERGYIEIGMDHFALLHDDLANAKIQGRLHRNFMGYTTSATDLLIGLGVSSIGDAKYAYSQNEKKVEDYEEAIKNKKFAIAKGHLMSHEDVQQKHIILNLICNKNIPWEVFKGEVKTISGGMDAILEMEEEGLLTKNASGLEVTEKGKTFLRNICMLFDLRLQSSGKEDSRALFSKAI